MTGTSLSFSFPAPCRRLSLNDRMHWQRARGITSKWRQSGHHYASHALGGMVWTPAPSDVLIVFEVPDPWRRRDPHNMAPTVKALVDGFKDAGVWPDDSSMWVAIIDPQFVKGPDRVRVDITARETL